MRRVHNLELHSFRGALYKEGLTVDHVDRNKYNTFNWQRENSRSALIIEYKDIQYYLLDFCNRHEYSEYLYSYLAQNKVSSITERDLETLLRKANMLQKYDCQQPKRGIKGVY